MSSVVYIVSKNGELWALAYILTPEGRSDFQKRAINFS